MKIDCKLLKGFLLVYAINSQRSFLDADYYRKIMRRCRTEDKCNVPVVLIGNKMDLDNERQVSKEEGEKYAQDNGDIAFLETSAKIGLNIQEPFIALIREFKRLGMLNGVLPKRRPAY